MQYLTRLFRKSFTKPIVYDSFYGQGYYSPLRDPIDLSPDYFYDLDQLFGISRAEFDAFNSPFDVSEKYQKDPFYHPLEISTDLNKRKGKKERITELPQKEKHVIKIESKLPSFQSKRKVLLSKILNTARVCIGEAFCTGFLVFFAITSASATPTSDALNLAFSKWLGRDMSGAHLNPIITFIGCFQRRIGIAMSLLYVLSQITGSILGGIIGRALVISDPRTLGDRNPKTIGLSLATLSENNEKNLFISFIVEIFASFYFFSVILAVGGACDCFKRPWDGTVVFIIGFATIPATLITKGLSSGHLNPARSIGTAIANWNFEDQWIFIVGPFVGAIMALVSSAFIFMPREDLIMFIQKLC